MTEQRDDHGGPRHHQQRPQDNRGPQRHVQQVVGGAADQRPGEQRPHRHQQADRHAGLLQLLEAKAEAPFEQDHGHRDRDDGQEHIAEELIWIEEAGDGADGEADEQQHKDRWDADPPR